MGRADDEMALVARTYALSVGQIAEWLVWTQLVATSFGDLHVFLPLKDEGVDGIVHRISTDDYARCDHVSGSRRLPAAVRQPLGALVRRAGGSGQPPPSCADRGSR
jgi:hypothetical protein